MITASALSSIDWLFEKAAQESSTAGPGDSCIVTELPPDSAFASKPKNRELVVLNISSYIFRIVTLIEFDKDASTISHLAKTLRRPESELVGQALVDAYAELVNMICGAVNRSLCTEFRHGGMSTPFFIDTDCANYLSVLNPTSIRAFEVVINEVTRFKLIACICVVREKTLDFNIDRSYQEDVATGELELF